MDLAVVWLDVAFYCVTRQDVVLRSTRIIVQK